MLIDQKTMDRIHAVQLEMWEQLSMLLDKMNINYYFVHGSLLGAVTRSGFIDEDDDIDIAIMRVDYERLIREGNKYLPSYFFLQSCMNDDFPMAFAKFRDSRTAFIQPVLTEYNCNKGLYIDIFPIDYCSEKKKSVRERILTARIQKRMNGRFSLKVRVLRAISCLLCPSYQYAVNSREKLYTSVLQSEFVCVRNGKANEQKIPAKWFKSTVIFKFCGKYVTCPEGYEDYLATIYGDEYLNYNPAEKRINTEKKIEISADILDFDKSYKEYCNKI